MQIQSGLMWYDNSVRSTFAQKLTEAAEAYQHKFGKRANVCYVHPSDLPERAVAPEELLVEAELTILPHHFFLGVTGKGR